MWVVLLTVMWTGGGWAPSDGHWYADDMFRAVKVQRLEFHSEAECRRTAQKIMVDPAYLRRVAGPHVKMLRLTDCAAAAVS